MPTSQSDGGSSSIEMLPSQECQVENQDDKVTPESRINITMLLWNHPFVHCEDMLLLLLTESWLANG